MIRLWAVCSLMSGCWTIVGGHYDGGAEDLGGPDDPGDAFSQDGPDGCPLGSPTAVKGRVFAPNGTLPLYNVTVYVPSSTPPAPSEGVSCDRCGRVAARSKAVTLTDAGGAFTLKGVPVGSSVPLVLEAGKWRRTITIPEVRRCETVAIAEADSRLPRNQSEGHLPKMAIATGELDPMECLLLKIGIDKSEFTAATGGGRVHFYRATTKSGTDLSPASPKADDPTHGLFAKPDQLRQYDVLLLPCEGAEHYTGTTDAQRALLMPYLDAGGRLFATHFSYNWLTYDKSPFDVIGKWTLGSAPSESSGTATVDDSFPRGAAFAKWLHNVDNKVTMMGTFVVQDIRTDLASVDSKYAQRWLYQASDQKVLHTTFNTPLNPPVDKDGKPAYCGRAVYSDFHVSATALNDPGSKASQLFPGACKAEPLTTQEKALAFMLFDLSACVMPDKEAPIP